MPQQSSSGQLDRGVDVTLHASGVETATGNGTAVELDDMNTLRLDLATTARSGTTPTLDVTIQTSADGSTNWSSIGTFTQVTNTGTQHKVFTGLDRYVRASWTIGGTTPSFTFAITGEAV